MKKILYKDLRFCSKTHEIPKNWTWVQNKLPNTFVQNLTKSLKILPAENLKKNDFRDDINRKHLKLSDNVNELSITKLP